MKEILKALITLRDPEKRHPDIGICSNMENICYSISNGDDYLQKMSVESWESWFDSVIPTWPKFSGSMLFPITVDNLDPEKLYLQDFYEESSCKWGDNPYGRARLELLEWLIEQATLAVNKLGE